MKRLGKFSKVLGAAAIAVSVLAATACSASSSSTAATAESTSSGETEANDGEVKKITVGISTTPSPNYFLDENGEEQGYELEMLGLIDDLLPQYEIEIAPMESKSLFVALNAGQVDAVVGNLRRSNAREADYIHTYRSYMYTPYRIVVEDTNTDINSIEDLNGKKLGIGQGSLQADIFNEYIEKTGADIELVYTKDYANDLISGRVDAFIAPQFTLDSYNANFEDVQFKMVGDVIASQEGNTSDSNAYIYLAKGSEDLRDDLSEAIYTLRENGKLSEINLKYYEEDNTKNIEVEHEEEQIAELGK